MPRVMHFEIHADQPERAAKFYSSVFGWEIDKWEGPMDYWLVTTGEEDEPGIDGAIMERIEGGSTWNSIGVTSVGEFIKKIEDSGGKVVMPKTSVPGIGFLAYCADTEGNVFGIMEDDPNAV